MLCKTCFINRVRRDGGDFGLCWQHKKSKCQSCGLRSGGKTLCSPCEHKEDIARWRAESQATYLDDDYDYVVLQLRQERLHESKFHVYRAVEVFFRAMALMLEALWGGEKSAREPEPPRDDGEAQHAPDTRIMEPEQRKAA